MPKAIKPKKGAAVKCIADLFDACSPADYLEALNEMLTEYVANIRLTGDHASDVVYRVNKIGVFLVKLNQDTNGI